MNLSFAGCGFLGIYHVGVAVCFKKYAPHLLLDKISGASAGCLAATCLLCDMPLVIIGIANRTNCSAYQQFFSWLALYSKPTSTERHHRQHNTAHTKTAKATLREMTSDFFRVVNEARSHSLGPFSPSFNIQTCLLEGLQKFLPPDAHERVNGRLHVSLTRSCDGKNIIVSQFDSREDLLQALLCACFIPGFSGILPPKFQGVRYMDGAFSDNLPVLDENTVTVSPFCGESDICPRDQSAQLFHVNWANTSIELSRQNINRFIRILFPPKPEVLSNMCQQGFDDALQFLHRNNLISCTRCLAVQSTFVVQEAAPETQEFDPECTECQQHRKAALIGNMPETVLTVFQTYIESANKGLANWMFRHKGTKILQALSLPATLPADFVCATLTKLVAAAPCIREQFWSLSKYVLSQLNAILKARSHQPMSGNIKCQLPLDLASKQKSKHILAHRSSKIDVFHNNQDGTLNVPIKEHIENNPGNNSEFNPAYSVELTDNPTQSEVDTFDHILEVTSHHEAVYAYYYMDDNNKVKLTKIFDLTDANSGASKGDGNGEQDLLFNPEWDAMPTTDCTHGTKTVKHLHKYAATNTAANLNNNSINVNNNQSARRQFSISEDGPTISEDDLDNLINQSINEWQQRQKSNGDDISIDSDIDQSTVILS